MTLFPIEKYGRTYQTTVSCAILHSSIRLGPMTQVYGWIPLGSFSCESVRSRQECSSIEVINCIQLQYLHISTAPSSHSVFVAPKPERSNPVALFTSELPPQQGYGTFVGPFRRMTDRTSQSLCQVAVWLPHEGISVD